MTAIAWAIVCAALLYVDSEYVKMFNNFRYETSYLMGGCIFFSMFMLLISTFRELLK